MWLRKINGETPKDAIQSSVCWLQTSLGPKNKFSCRLFVSIIFVHFYIGYPLWTLLSVILNSIALQICLIPFSLFFSLLSWSFWYFHIFSACQCPLQCHNGISNSCFRQDYANWQLPALKKKPRRTQSLPWYSIHAFLLSLSENSFSLFTQITMADEHDHCSLI